MTEILFLKNIAFTFFWTAGEYTLILMAWFLLLLIFGGFIYYLTK